MKYLSKYKGRSKLKLLKEILRLNVLSTLERKKNFTLKSCDKFTISQILRSTPREHVQNIAKLVALYSEDESLKNHVRDFCLKAPIVN